VSDTPLPFAGEAFVPFMALEALEHFTITCADLERTRDFYRDVLGLKEGYRPNFNFAGYWLYFGDVPVVHLTDEKGAIAENRQGSRSDTNTGRLDHIAFRGRDPQTTIANLKAHNITYRENEIPDARLHQIFVRDPNGIMIEMNFRS
jgi:catechol 2,3-dioxygenase-like lactoylglutathione lyase family enzyme